MTSPSSIPPVESNPIDTLVSVIRAWVDLARGPHGKKAIVGRYQTRRKRLHAHLVAIGQKIGWDGPISEVQSLKKKITILIRSDEHCSNTFSPGIIARDDGRVIDTHFE